MQRTPYLQYLLKTIFGMQQGVDFTAPEALLNFC